MNYGLTSLPQTEVCVDAKERLGPLELWRHSFGQGGINPLPLPARALEGIRRLRPRLVRVFLQEYFQIYPDHGRFDWSKLDPFMDALVQTGAKVVAAISIKPRVLFPAVDHAVWRPNDVGEWQHLIRELVTRYSAAKPIVTHWEIGNETDIGENGGCPYLIPDPDDYFEYYRMTTHPILEACPSAKVGGPASCWVDNEPLPGLIERCRRTGVRLDFVSWHLYHDDPARHADGVEKAKALLAAGAGQRPEMMVTEWSKSFDRVSVEELAFHPRRAANVAASIVALLDAGLDWSFYYHIWDQVFRPDDFAPFFSEAGLRMMMEHWNERPHRFGLFGVNEEVRPQYFVYQMLSRMGEERVAAHSSEADLRVLAGIGARDMQVLLVNFGLSGSQDRLVRLSFRNLVPGPKRLVVRRVDTERRWSVQEMELVPVEQREVFAESEFRCQIYSPADSVALVRLDGLS
jgi:hypothetical protein